MKKSRIVPKIWIALYLLIVPIFVNSAFWHYSPKEFVVSSEIMKKELKVEDIAIKKVSWSSKEKRLALYIKTEKKLYKDLYLFCQKKLKYYYCPIEDDGGYVKIDNQMNLKLDVAFAKETEEGMVSELKVEQKNKNAWIKPIKMPLSSVKPKCSVFDKSKDKTMFFKIKKRYPELTMEKIKKLKPGRYYDPKYGVSIVAPMAWKNITKEGDAILYLIGSKDEETRKFMFKQLAKFWDEAEAKKPNKIIEKANKFITEIVVEDAGKRGFKIEPLSKLKIVKTKHNILGHFVLKRTGKKSRWESYTLLWNGNSLYIIVVMSQKDELLMGEFLSSLGAESFCSERKE